MSFVVELLDHLATEFVHDFFVEFPGLIVVVLLALHVVRLGF